LERIGKYETLSVLGGVPIGMIYRARDTLTGRLVALRTVPSSAGDFLAPFRREAQIAERLQYPNFILASEVGEADGVSYAATEYLEGDSLDHVASGGMELSLMQKVRCILDICRALEYAHCRGVIHRGIRPSNVFVTGECVVKILGFSSALLEDSTAEIERTPPAVLFASYPNLAPEHLRSLVANAATDIWALGATAYELLTCRKPFASKSAEETISNILSKDPPPLCDLAPGCPVELARIVERMLQKNLTRRYQTVDEPLHALEQVYTSLTNLSADSAP
jgi:eukaryotic-like serine/threonine-protein kinase